MTVFGRPPQLAKLHTQAIQTLVDAVVFDSTDQTYTSAGVPAQDYREFALLVDLVIANDPTDIVIRVQISDDDATFRTLMNGPFGDLRYDDSAGNKNEAITGKVIAPYMRIHVVSSGCEATKTFTLTVKAVLTK